MLKSETRVWKVSSIFMNPYTSKKKYLSSIYMCVTALLTVCLDGTQMSLLLSQLHHRGLTKSSVIIENWFGLASESCIIDNLFNLGVLFIFFFTLFFLYFFNLSITKKYWLLQTKSSTVVKYFLVPSDISWFLLFILSLLLRALELNCVDIHCSHHSVQIDNEEMFVISSETEWIRKCIIEVNFWIWVLILLFFCFRN